MGNHPLCPWVLGEEQEVIVSVPVWLAWQREHDQTEEVIATVGDHQVFLEVRGYKTL